MTAISTVFTVHGTTEDLVKACFKPILFTIEPMGTRWQQCGMDFMVTIERQLFTDECKAIEAKLREWGANRVTACWEARFLVVDEESLVVDGGRQA
jgi:hypothetical protein